ncbi:MAG: 50S ribosome-binding GTPase [Bacteroidetes bacterium]|nr:50S ribosome-binding GTPase [Bacteroidota bacterium]
MKKQEPIVQPPSDACATCPMHDASALKRLGVDMKNFDYVVALAGNPNTGKSTVFNSLTGLRQHTGNWPGKTVTRMEGGFEYAGLRYKLVDLPGTYSLLATSEDELVARDFILFGQPDVTLVVVDATRLERNLNLALQVSQITERAVLCLNLMDEAKRKGMHIDDRRLARDLGMPVVPMSARQNEGIPELLGVIGEVAASNVRSKPYRVSYQSPQLRSSLSRLTEMIERSMPDLPNAEWVALRLLDGDAAITEALLNGELGEMRT